MRNIIIILLLLITSSTRFNNISVYAETDFARIEKTTELYKTNIINSNLDNILCLAEESYFVEIIADYDNLYKVTYNSVTGYIKKTDVKRIVDSPITPYPYNIKIVMNTNCNLRSSPTTKTNANNVISTIYSNTTDITFIGRTVGEEAIDFGGNTWYYICYDGQYGYIYNNYIKTISPIYKNNEKFTYKEDFVLTTINPITHTPSLIIMIVLAIPLILVLLILYLPNKHKHIKHKKQKIIHEIDRY